MNHKQSDSLISIIIPTYNSLPYIIDSVRSALAQKECAVEVIVVDDGSSDNTKKVLTNIGLLQDSRLTYIYQENKGVACARNLGLSTAKGDYICFLDSDDILDEYFCRKMQTFLETNKLNVGYADNYNINTTGNRIKNIIKKYKPQNGYIFEKLLCGNFLLTPTVFIKESIIAGKRFVDGIKYNEDWLFWLEICREENIGFLNEELVGIRLRQDSLTQNKSIVAEYFIRALKLIEKLYLDNIESVKAKAFRSYAINLLSLRLPNESVRYFRKAGRISFDFAFYIKYVMRYFLTVTGSIILLLKIKRLFSRSRYNYYE